MCTIKFAPERDTKNAMRFTEVLEGNMTNQIMGSVYFQKDAAKAKGYKEGQYMEVTVRFIDPEPADGATTFAAKNEENIRKYKEAQAKKKAAKKAPANKAPAKSAPKQEAKAPARTAKKAPAKTAKKAPARKTRAKKA